MKKAVFFVGVAVSLFISAGVQSFTAPDPSPGLVSYPARALPADGIYAAGGLRFHFLPPDGWIMPDTRDDGTASFVQFTPPQIIGASLSIDVNAMPDAPGGPLAGFERIAKLNRQSYAKYEFRKTRFAGHKAFEETGDRGGTRSRKIYFAVKNIVITIVYTDTLTGFERNAPLVKESLKSFELLPAIGPRQ